MADKNNVQSLFDLSARTAIVTGSGYGLGKYMAIGLSDAGANVIVSGRSHDKLETTVNEIKDKGGTAAATVFDATRPQDCQRLVDSAFDRFGGLDIMIINHGVVAVNTPQQTTDEEWQHIIEVNLSSCFYCARAAGTRMISHQLAMEWGQHGIRVNTINPGYTENPMGGRPRDTLTADVERAIKQRTPLGRRGRVDEFIGPVLFLASDASSFVSGHCLTVDGGYCIT